MRKIVVLLFVSLLVAVCGAAIGDNKFYTKVAPNGAVGTFEWSSTSVHGLPSQFTVWSADAGEFWITFYPGGVAESLSVHVPAGRSVTMPTPARFDTSGTYYTKFTVSGHADSVYAVGYN